MESLGRGISQEGGSFNPMNLWVHSFSEALTDLGPAFTQEEVILHIICYFIFNDDIKG